MAKQTWKPGNMVYPLPAAMVSVGCSDGRTNIITIAETVDFLFLAMLRIPSPIK